MVQSLRRSKSFRILFNSPELVEEQRSGFHHFLKHGIAEELSKISFLEVKRQNVDIEVFLDPSSFQLIAPDENSRNCVIKMKTYACKLYVQIRLVWKKKSGEILMQTEPEWVLLAHLPMMTKRGHFVINGSPRVIVHQIVRAPGVYFQKFGKVKKDERNKARFYGDIIPRKGVWVRLQISKTGQVEIKLKKSTKVQAEMVERCLAVIEKQELSKRQTFAHFATQSERKFPERSSVNSDNVFFTSSQFKRIFDPASGQAEVLPPVSTDRVQRVRRLFIRQTKLRSRRSPRMYGTSLQKKKMATFSSFRGQSIRTSSDSGKFMEQLSNSVRDNVLQQSAKSVSELSKQQQVDHSLSWIRKAFGLLLGCFANFAAPSCSVTQSTGSDRALENFVTLRNSSEARVCACLPHFASQSGRTFSSLRGLTLRSKVAKRSFGKQASSAKVLAFGNTSVARVTRKFSTSRLERTALKFAYSDNIGATQTRATRTVEKSLTLAHFATQSERKLAKRLEQLKLRIDYPGTPPKGGLIVPEFRIIPKGVQKRGFELSCSEKLHFCGAKVCKQPNRLQQNYCSRSKDMAITGISKPFLGFGVMRCREITYSSQTSQNMLLQNALSKQQLRKRSSRNPVNGVPLKPFWLPKVSGVRPMLNGLLEPTLLRKVGESLPNSTFRWANFGEEKIQVKGARVIEGAKKTTKSLLYYPSKLSDGKHHESPVHGAQSRTFVVRSRTTNVEGGHFAHFATQSGQSGQSIRKFGPKGLDNRAPKDLSEKLTKAELKGDDRAFTNVYDNLYRVPEMKELEDKMYPKGSSIPIDTEFKRDFSYKHIFATFKAPWRYSLGTVGRHKLNKKFGLDLEENQLTSRDLQAARNWLVRLRDGKEIIDDIDHFQNRRVRQSGELIQNQFENGVTRLRKLIRRKLRTPTFESVPFGLLHHQKRVPSITFSKSTVDLSPHSLAVPFLFSKAEQEAECMFLSGGEIFKTGVPETRGFVKLRRAVGASLAPYNPADILLIPAAQTGGTLELQKSLQEGSSHRPLPVSSNSSLALVRARQSEPSSDVEPSRPEVRIDEPPSQPEFRERMFRSLLTPSSAKQSQGVISEAFSDPSSANFSQPIRKSSLFSRANLWKLRESLCFYTRDKGKRIPQWQLRINSRQTPFQYFLPRLLLTDRHGLLSKAWARNRTDLKYNQADHAVGRLFPTKGGLWASRMLDYVKPTQMVLEKDERFSILCTIKRSVNKSAPIAGFAFVKPTHSSLVLAGLSRLGGLPELRNTSPNHRPSVGESVALADRRSAVTRVCGNFVSQKCSKSTKGQLLLVFSKAEQEAESGSKRVLTSRSSSVPTFGKLSLHESSRYAKVGQKAQVAQALNPFSGVYFANTSYARVTQSGRNSGAPIELSISIPIRCHIVRRFRQNVVLGPELSLRQLERNSEPPKRVIGTSATLRNTSVARVCKVRQRPKVGGSHVCAANVCKKGYILFSTARKTKSGTLHNQKAQKIKDFARLPYFAWQSGRTAGTPKGLKKDAILEFLGDSPNRAKLVGGVVLAPFGDNLSVVPAKTSRLVFSKKASKPTRFAKSISLKRDSKPKGQNFRRGYPKVSQAKAISLNRILKQASELFSTKPINGALREFFGINPLSQYMDQTNPLAELTHKRRISSLGIGGVSRESAGMAIRGIHPTHYGRICPIETPEGKNAGLVNSLALYARLNKHGFIETPYYKVIKGQVQEELGFSYYSALKETVDRLHLAPSDLQQSQANMLGQLSPTLLRKVSESSLDRAVTRRQTRQGPSASGRFMTKGDASNHRPSVGESVALADRRSAVTATGTIHAPKDRFFPKGVQYGDGIVQATAKCLVPVRVADTLLDVFKKVTPYEVDCIGISPVQILSVATSLIPFLEHNDANRALMGSNMQRQAVPLMISERPIVGTGLETLIAAQSGQVIQSSTSGLVSYVSANKIIIERLFHTSPRNELDQLRNLFLRTFPNRPISRKMDGPVLLSQMEHRILGSLCEAKWPKAPKDVAKQRLERASLWSASKSVRNILLSRRPFVKAKLSFAETKPRKLSVLLTSRRNDSLRLQWTTPQIWLDSIWSSCAIKPVTDWTTRGASNRARTIWQNLSSFRALISRRGIFKKAPSAVSKRRRLPHEFRTPFLLTQRCTELRSVHPKRRSSKKAVQRSERYRFSESHFVKASRALSDLRSALDSPRSNLQTVTLNPLLGLPEIRSGLAPSLTRAPRTLAGLPFANRRPSVGESYARVTLLPTLRSKVSRPKRKVEDAHFASQSDQNFVYGFRKHERNSRRPKVGGYARVLRSATKQFSRAFAGPTLVGQEVEGRFFSRADLLLACFRETTKVCAHPLASAGRTGATRELQKLTFGRASIHHKSVSSAGYRSLCAQTLLRKSTWFCVAKSKKPKNHVLFSELSQLYKKKVKQSWHKLSVFGLLSAPDVRSGNFAERKLSRNRRPSVGESYARVCDSLGAKLLLESHSNRARAAGNRAPRSRFSETSQEMTLFPFVHSLRSFSRSNQETCLTQKPLIQEGEWVQKGDVLTDCSASEKGELAVGKNVMIAYLPWEGYNFEDAIVVSDRLTKEQIYASLHIERYVCEAQDIKEKITNSNEWFTRNLPGVNPKLVSHLDTFGFPKIGTILNEGDILVGKMRYFRNKPTTPYEKLLSDILGDGHFSVSLTSLRVPKGVHEARVISHRVVKTFRSSLENTFTGVSRPAGTPKMVNIFLGEKRTIQIGDKMSGRHGNKGIISTILPKQDMPYLPDGSPIDILLNPLGVPSRMNVGQIFESLLGLASTYLNQNFKITAFDELYGVEASQSLVYLKLYQARLQSGQNWLFQINFPGKTCLIDGRSGECFDQWVTVGRAYMLKLIHMVNEKIHARNTGPYALITQQPLRGRSQKGGQRLGEMEVWALEGYGAAYILQELLTKKSDDFAGRQEIINTLVVRSDKFSSPENPYRDYSNPDDPYQRFSDPDNPYQVIQETRLVLGHPEIFKTLICELQALCLDVGVYALKKDSFQREYLGIVN